MIRKTVKKRCLKCAHMGDYCENCKHHYTSNYQEMIPRSGHDIAPPQHLTPPFCRLCGTENLEKNVAYDTGNDVILVCQSCHDTSPVKLKTYRDVMAAIPGIKAPEEFSCHSCSFWKPLDGLCCHPAGKEFPMCHSLNAPGKAKK